ncbi:MAG: bifunctional nuclease family protein [Euzebyales bacterium]|nr:bifunctional nuclease family protein [Euzebyales bacterium]
MTAQPSDPALVAAAREGDRTAFAVLVRRHRPMLEAVCRRMLHDRELAQDAAQEAVLGALLNVDRLRRPDRFGAWLAGIGLNRCRQVLRQRARESWETLHGGRAVTDCSDDGPSPADLAEAAEMAALVRRAIAALPPGQREATALYYLDGLTHRELAAALGTTVGAVKTRLHKARSHLRRDLLYLREEPAMATSSDAIEMTVVDVHLLRGDGGCPEKYVVLLRDGAGERLLPIWVGPFEATAIAMTLQGTQLPRPGPHQLTARALRAVGSEVVGTHIERLDEGTFYATVRLQGPRGPAEVDARPSDALNLALLVGATITADPAVLHQVDEQQAAGDCTPADRLEHESVATGEAIAAEAMARWKGERGAQPPRP